MPRHQTGWIRKNSGSIIINSRRPKYIEAVQKPHRDPLTSAENKDSCFVGCVTLRGHRTLDPRLTLLALHGYPTGQPNMMHLMIPHHSHVQTPPSEEEDPLDALDKVKEILADGDHPFPIDRRTLRDVMRNKMGQEVERIKFLSSGMSFERLWRRWY
jgi:hypothetical protein